MKRLRLVRHPAAPTHQVPVLARHHPWQSLRRWWPAAAMLVGVVAVVATLVVQSYVSGRRGQDVAALGSVVDDQNTALASAGLPTVNPSTVVSGPQDLPGAATSTVTVTATPNGLPTTTPLIRPPLLRAPPAITYTITRDGVVSTVTATVPAQTLPGQTLPGGVRTVTSTTTAPGQVLVRTETSTTTAPPPPPVVITTTEPAPPPVTVTETVPGPETTVTATVTETTTAPPPDPEPPSDPNPDPPAEESP